MSEKTVYCSFCVKSQHEVTSLIAGPGDTFICNECVGICNEMIRDRNGGVPMHERSTADQLVHLHKAVVDLNKSLLKVMERATDKGEVEQIIAQRVRSLALRPIINSVEG